VVSIQRWLLPREGGDQHQVARARLMQIRQDGINCAEAVARIDKKIRPAFARLYLCPPYFPLRDSLKRSDDSSPHRYDPLTLSARAIDGPRSAKPNTIPLCTDAMILNLPRADVPISG